MNKTRIFFMATAVTLAVGGAVAHDTNKKAYCDYFPQYIPTINGFQPAGQLGINYLCFGAIGTCTYYQPTPWSDFVPCRSGLYIRVL